MRRPHEMRTVGLSRYDCQLIGEIAVLSGILEQEMKELIVKLVGAPWPSGLALTTHLNFGSLCDMSRALLMDTIEDTKLRDAFDKTIIRLKSAYDDRSRAIHGPFSIWPALATGTKKATFRLTARGRIKPSGFVFETETLRETLYELIDLHETLAGLRLVLEKERGEVDR